MKYPWDNERGEVRKRWLETHLRTESLLERNFKDPNYRAWSVDWECQFCRHMACERYFTDKKTGALRCPKCGMIGSQLYQCDQLVSDFKTLKVGDRVVLRYGIRRKPGWAIRRGVIESIDYSDPHKMPIKVLCDPEKGKPTHEYPFFSNIVLENEYDAARLKGPTRP